MPPGPAPAPLQVIVEMRKESGGTTLDVNYLDVWFQQVGVIGPGTVTPLLTPGSIPPVSSFSDLVQAKLGELSVPELVAMLVAKRLVTIPELESL